MYNFTSPNQPYYLGCYHAGETNPAKQDWVLGKWDHILKKVNLEGNVRSLSLMLHGTAADPRSS